MKRDRNSAASYAPRPARGKRRLFAVATLSLTNPNGWDRMSEELVSLSRILHGRESGERLFFMLGITAYCDESVRNETGVLVMAGYLGTLRQWQHFDQGWNADLFHDKLPEFKASDCEKGNGAFEGRCKEERQGSYQRFVARIAESQLLASVVVTDLHAYAPIRPEMDALREIPRKKGGVTKFGDPFYPTFEYLVALVANWTRTAPPGEQVLYVFDENKEYGSKCYQLFCDLKSQKEAELAHRMRSMVPGDSRDFPGLQAADILAFEVRRHVEEVVWARRPAPERWQWDALTVGRKIKILQFTENGVETLLDRSRARWGNSRLDARAR
jgi:Protein of unknown function (DUF3800)